MLKNFKLWRGLVVVFALVMSIFIVLTNLAYYYAGFVNDFFGITPPTVQTTDETNYYPAAHGEMNAENCKKLIADEDDFNIRAMEEGAVMLRNENNALPLKKNERRVTFFGNSVKDPVYATNAGGSNFKADRGGSLYDAFEAAGFAINDTLFNAYKDSKVKRISSSESGKSDIGEVGQDFYTSALKDSYTSDYNDVAFVLFTRYGGEGVDLEYKSDADGVPLLSLHPEEKDLLKMIKDSGKFKKTVVLVNSPFAMDIEWIEDEQYGVDACLAFGAAGDVGFKGIANLLTGKADPSGHLTDTYATDSMSAPAMRNFGDFTFSNHTTRYENKYVVYAENIYVGYKYYETRYYDSIVNPSSDAASSAGVYASTGNWNYAEEMAYTFGYGLSYANFTQEVQEIKWDREAHKVVATVKVTNNGSDSYSGKSKSVVQLYVNAPYTAGGVEKSAIQLIGFTKSGALAKGESEVCTVEADDYLFASYDNAATNGADPTKKGCYIFDKGEYCFAIGENAHDALNNVLAAQGKSGMTDEQGNVVAGDAGKAVAQTLNEYDNTTYATSGATGVVVSNVYDEIDYNHFKANGVRYLTRADWKSYPIAYEGLETTEEMNTLLNGKSYVKDESVTPDSVTYGVEADISFVEMKDVAYDNEEEWDKFISQLTVNELATVIGETMGNAAIKSVGKPANANTDGPKGLGASYKNGDKSGVTLYVDEVVMASTFNLDLLEERGRLFAEDALYAGYSMIFGPGANWHRTAYSGRNSEYYSEEPNMSYLCGAAQVKAMQKGGLISSVKHFVGNDQETNRHGVATFATEQGFRQGSLRCFEGALRDDVGGSLGTMTCFNRIGCTAGAASRATLVSVLRDEWGFRGVNLTDSSKDAADYVHTEECVVDGTDMFNNDASRTDDLIKLVKQGKDGTILKMMQEINKHYYYAYSRSNLVNGLTKDTVVEDFIPWWQPTLITIDVVFGVLTLASLVMFVLGGYVFKKEGK